jgi:hypothetical protein
MIVRGAGQWKRGGMSGQIVGLDIAGLLASPRAGGCDAGALETILMSIEEAVIKVEAARAEQR